MNGIFTVRPWPFNLGTNAWYGSFAPNKATVDGSERAELRTKALSIKKFFIKSQMATLYYLAMA